MRVLVLIDGLHTSELLAALAQVVRLQESELLLVYVRGPGARAGLDMVRHRPGRHGLPSYRERGIAEAEQARSADALTEAENLAGPLAAAVRTFQVEGEPGRAVCDIAVREAVDLVALRAGGRDQPPVGQKSLGPAARFIADHSPCPVLLLRGGR